MSTTLINYDFVVQELSKGLIALDSEEALRCNMLPHLALAEFRTIRFGSGRQCGATSHMLKMLYHHDGKSLVLVPSLPMVNAVRTRYLNAHHDVVRSPTILPDYPDHIRHVKFSQVFILDAGIYFNKYSYDRVFKYLAECTTPDVTIYLIN